MSKKIKFTFKTVQLVLVVVIITILLFAVGFFFGYTTAEDSNYEYKLYYDHYDHSIGADTISANLHK